MDYYPNLAQQMLPQPHLRRTSGPFPCGLGASLAWGAQKREFLLESPTRMDDYRGKSHGKWMICEVYTRKSENNMDEDWEYPIFRKPPSVLFTSLDVQNVKIEEVHL